MLCHTLVTQKIKYSRVIVKQQLVLQINCEFHNINLRLTVPQIFETQPSVFYED